MSSTCVNIRRCSLLVEWRPGFAFFTRFENVKWFISLRGIKLTVFEMEKKCIFFEAGPYLWIINIYVSFIFQILTN